MRSKIQKTIQIAFIICPLVFLTTCGGSTQVSEKMQRKSERFYEAASIAWFEEQDTLAAIRNLTRAVDADPKNDHAHYLLGIIRFGRGEYDKAEKHLKETTRLREAGDPTGLSGARNNLGLLYIHLKRHAEAVELLEASANEVLNREPWLAMGNLGWAYIELGEYDKAIEILRRAMFDQPKFCVGLYRLGQAYYLKKDYAAAETSLKQAVEVPEPGCDAIQEAYQLLGMSYLRLGEDAKAKGALRRCQDITKTTEIGALCTEALTGL
ncbi:MAG: tetratricopeptide repeat protein [Proteobacteria bacterium]|nr:tetratricopeptide repeat protein [Pseudomonadota bacterium]